jgi:hypothetical protein
MVVMRFWLGDVYLEGGRLLYEEYHRMNRRQLKLENSRFGEMTGWRFSNKQICQTFQNSLELPERSLD